MPMLRFAGAKQGVQLDFEVRPLYKLTRVGLKPQKTCRQLRPKQTQLHLASGF